MRSSLALLVLLVAMCAPKADTETTQSDSTTAAADTTSSSAPVAQDAAPVSDAQPLKISNVPGDVVNPVFAAYLDYPLDDAFLLVAPVNGVGHSVFPTKEAGAVAIATISTPKTCKILSQVDGEIKGECTDEVWYEIEFHNDPNEPPMKGWVRSLINGMYKVGEKNIVDSTFEFPDAGRLGIGAMSPMTTYVSWGEGEECVDMHLMYFYDDNRIYLIENKEFGGKLSESDYIIDVHMDNFCNGLFGYFHQMRRGPHEMSVTEEDGSVKFTYGETNHRVTISWADGRLYSYGYTDR